MNDYKNFCEYVATPKLTPGRLAARIILMIVYTAFVAVYSLIFWLMLGLWPLMILLPFIMYAAIRITWKYTVVEYEYSIEAGELRVAAIYNGSARRTKLRTSIPEMTLISPYTAESSVALNKGDIAEVKNYAASGDGESAYLCIYPDKKRGKKCAVIIETTPEAERILRFCNPTAFVKAQR